MLVATSDWLKSNPLVKLIELIEVSGKIEMNKIQVRKVLRVLAVFMKPSYQLNIG